MEDKGSWLVRLWRMVVGTARNPFDRSIFHKLSLAAFFAWVGLGSDGLSSANYGPPEAFVNLGGFIHLGFFVALATVITIVVVSASYSQIIELFPTGGGGYLVASKLLNPNVGMVAGCALLIDYVLTIAVSIASGTDALFSMLPPQWQQHKLAASLLVVAGLTVLNMRGVRESVIPLVPLFIVFVLTHLVAIVYSVCDNAGQLTSVAAATQQDMGAAVTKLGVFGTLVLVMHAYGMGAGTYTGIEAVSNGLPMLREPRVQTGKRTMVYMAISLSVMAMGLMVGYILYHVQPDPNKTLNAVLLEKVTAGWGSAGFPFVVAALASAATILYVAAQTGFLGGPRVLATMAMDRWFPARFAVLSDRLVTQNGIVMMGGAAAVIMFFAGGSVGVLVVLYSINVFITFVLSQLGMVRHWWAERGAPGAHWRKGLTINGLGLVLCAFILVTVTIIKFHEGGWVTLLITGSLVGLALLVKRHYTRTLKLLKRLDDLVKVAQAEMKLPAPPTAQSLTLDPNEKTAILLVSGFNGLGLHATFNIIRLFEGVFRNFAFVQVGVVDAGNFKGVDEVDNLRAHTRKEVDKYVDFMRRNGYNAEGFNSVGVDLADELTRLSVSIYEKYPRSIFFAGQLVFPQESIFNRWLHNFVVFDVQRRFYRRGIPMVLLPIRV